MSAEAAPLAELLRALAPRLEYLAAEDVRRLVPPAPALVLAAEVDHQPISSTVTVRCSWMSGFP